MSLILKGRRKKRGFHCPHLYYFQWQFFYLFLIIRRVFHQRRCLWDEENHFHENCQLAHPLDFLQHAPESFLLPFLWNLLPVTDPVPSSAPSRGSGSSICSFVAPPKHFIIFFFSHDTAADGVSVTFTDRRPSCLCVCAVNIKLQTAVGSPHETEERQGNKQIKDRL